MLSFNSSKPTKRLDALSGLVCQKLRSGSEAGLLAHGHASRGPLRLLSHLGRRWSSLISKTFFDLVSIIKL
jgi:hypothetical protein